MSRDDCRDCERPVAGDRREFDGRCSECHEAFLERQAVPAKPPAKAAAKGKKE